ncbi:MAG TPA: TlpA disulfide reductase family protein [Baekduia sp.]|uniref:TlpA family protein disulfide reductase n=1 Tax=Baekduia sp. TaxID=2600305 RepID=UPI002D793F9C|nr:TlpA disulfide reductase family protein [Baekduia sp.]HET6508719.1 TlpA disulfide reductase family protein [Baekduia sp.]
MDRRRLSWIVGALAVVAFVAIGLTQTKGDNKAPKANHFDLAAAQRRLAGAPAPLAALHAKASTLVPDAQKTFSDQIDALKGHPIVVNKWASWCGPCRAEFPVLQETSTKLGKQVAFVGLDASDDDATARTFLSQFPVPYPSYVDRNAHVAQKLGIGQSFPTTLYYDAKGKVAYVHQGSYATAGAFERDIRRYAMRTAS